MKKLFNSFDEHDSSEWKNIIIKELKDQEFNSLAYETLEGIKIDPFYTFESNKAKNFKLKKTQKEWDIFTYQSDINLLNTNEVDGIVINLKKNKPTNQFKNILVSNNPFLFLNFLNEPRNTFFKLDIYGGLITNGNWYKTQEEDEKLIQDILNNSEIEKIICIDNTIFQNGGANIIQQLALALCHANEYIEKFGNDIIKRIYFNFSVGGNFFFEIAKLRAFRFLWDSFISSKNINSEAYIFTESSLRNKSALDKDNNTIRSSIECCAAILGGSNGILINSHEIESTNKSEFSLELAHKIQLIFKKESYLNKFSDPIEGNYYVESITDQLINQASVLFKDIEKNGGLIIGLENESIQKMIEKSNEKELEWFNSQKNILIGVNKYKLESINPPNEFNEPDLNQNKSIKPIVAIRLAEYIELNN